MEEVITGKVYKAEVLVNSILVTSIGKRQDKKIYPRLEEIDDLVEVLKAGKRALENRLKEES